MNREIESLGQLRAQLRTGCLANFYIQGLDLSDVEADLAGVDVVDAVFLGCAMSTSTADVLRAGGAEVFPVLPHVPVNAYRSTLYTAAELYGDVGYADSLDHRAYVWSQESSPSDVGYSLGTALHDHAIHDALLDFVEASPTRRVVGVMGGHALARDTPGYRDAARLGQQLAQQGILVATGGGPGAMEAANLGACLAYQDLEQALQAVAQVPSFRPSIDAWATAGFDALASSGSLGESLGIPTWHYGHEPPNVFASHIAKYFSNAIREDILLSLCRGGLVYLEGAAGTVQEIFQAVTANYYAADATRLTPLILVGRDQWTRKVPVWPLLESLASGRSMQDAIVLVDTVDDATAWLGERVS